MATVGSDENCVDEVISPSANSDPTGKMERSMGSLPDQLWLRVLRLGVEGRALDYRDLCSLSFVSHRLRRLSASDCVWHLAYQQKFASEADYAPELSKPAKEKEATSARPPKSKKRKTTNAPHHRSFRNRQLVVKS